MAEPTFEKMLQRVTKENVESAQKAVDYLHNDMLRHMSVLLDDQIKDWRLRKFLPVYENPTRIMIERSAKSYKSAPKRTVVLNETPSESLTNKYRELLATTDLNFISQDLDARARLLSASIILPQVAKDDKQTITLSVLSRNNCAVDIDPTTNEATALIYTAGNYGANGGLMYHYWTKDKIVDIEGSKQVGSEDNPYGIIPIAILNDTRPPLGSKLWRYPSWEQLLQLSDGVNLFNTEALFNARYGMIGSPVTNAKITKGTVFGIDTAIELDSSSPGDPVFFEFRSPTSNIEGFLPWFTQLKEIVADEWGVNLDYSGNGSAESGFKLVVEEFENIELRQTRIVSAKQYEQDLYQVFAVMSDVHGWGLDKNAVGVADFDEPSLPVNKTEDWTLAKEKIALGVMTIEEYWLEQNPDLTPEQIADKSRKRAAASGMAGAVPTFEEV